MGGVILYLIDFVFLSFLALYFSRCLLPYLHTTGLSHRDDQQSPNDSI